MYYPYLILYMGAGLTVSILAILWAYKNGQFRDQARARFLPLENEPSQPQKELTRSGRYELYALVIIVSLGLISSAALLFYSLFFMK